MFIYKNKILVKFIFSVIMLTSQIFLQDLEYYGLKYAEKAIESESLDPICSENTFRFMRLAELFNARLWTRDERLQKQSDLVVDIPDLEQVGQRLDEISVELKSDVSWPDGTPITTDDILATFRIYSDEKYFDKSNKFSEYYGIASKLIVEKVDASNFNIKRANDSVKGFARLVLDGIPQLYILPAHLIENNQIECENEYSKSPIGSGPFILKDIRKNGAQTIIEFDRNKKYHFNAPTRAIKKITMVNEPISTNMITAISKRTSDTYNSETMTHDGLDLLVEEVSSKLARRRLSRYEDLENESYERNSWMGLAFNTTKPLLNSAEFRILIDKMIENKFIIDEIYPNGDARSISGPFHPDFGIYNEGLYDRYEQNKEVIINELENFNVSMIDGKLQYRNQMTGEISPLSFRIICDKLLIADDTREQVALGLIKSTLESYGIEIIVDTFDPSVFNERVKDLSYWDLAFKRYIFSWDSNIFPLFDKNDQSYNIT